LHQVLDRHPDIYMAKPVAPEPKFFLVDHLYDKGLTYYADTWFAPAGKTQQAGEKSADYLESDPAARRIARDLPQAKLVFSLREPAARAYSNYLWTRMNGLESEGFGTALALEDQRERELPERWKFARPFSYFSRGLYADLLGSYLGRFPREQILVIRFEDIESRAPVVAERLHRFLGVSPRPEDASSLGMVNPSEVNGATFDEGIRRELIARYADSNRRLAGLLPDFEMWPA
jgi:hypothetical protein